MPLEIDVAGARYTRDAREQARFRERHWLRLPALLDEPLLERIERGLATTVFHETRHRAVTVDSGDLRVIGTAITEMLVLLCNDPVVLRAIDDITGCGTVTRFNGSIYRMVANSRHLQEWHDDLIDGRVVALSVNLGLSQYQGGELEIRDRDTRAAVAQVANTARGDGVLFNLDPSLEHRVTQVTSGVKTAFAGWFRRGTTLRDELRGASIQLEL